MTGNATNAAAAIKAFFIHNLHISRPARYRIPACRAEFAG
jgi:hypothetical protein